jgi:hypothetical protein
MPIIQSSPRLIQELSSHLTVCDLQFPPVDFRDLDLSTYDFRSLVVALRDEKHFHSFLSTLKFKSSNLLFLCKLIGRFPLPMKLIYEYCSCHVMQMAASAKRLVPTVRLLRLALSFAKRPARLFEWLTKFENTDSALFHLEFGKLLLSVEIGHDSPSPFAQRHSLFQRFAPYLGIAAIQFSCTAVSLPETLFLTFLAADHIPSVRLAALEAVEYVVRGHPAAWAAFESIAAPFFAAVADVQDRPLFGARITAIVCAMLRRYEFGNRPEAVTGVCNLIFSLPKSSPSIRPRIALIPMLTPVLSADNKQYQSFVLSVMKSVDGMALGLAVLVDYAKWRFTHITAETERRDFGHWIAGHALRFLASSPSDENIVRFLNTMLLAPSGPELAVDGIVGLAADRFHPIKLVLAAHRARKKCGTAQIETCARKIAELSRRGGRIYAALEMVFCGESLRAAENACRPLTVEAGE